jgi:hypothetical protein
MTTLMELLEVIDPKKAKELNDFLQHITLTIKFMYVNSSMNMDDLRKADKVFRQLKDGYNPPNASSALETLRDAVTHTIEAERLLMSVVENLNVFFKESTNDHTNSDSGTNGS